jgi:hypothetical protein
MSKPADSFPRPIRINGRLFWRRSELESYKRKLISAALGLQAATSQEPETVETFVTSQEVAREFAFTRRTLGRRIAGRVGEIG